MIDYDRDGALDLFATGGGSINAAPAPPELRGRPSALFRNLSLLQFASVGPVAGFSDPPDYSLGCSAVDFDADGFDDLFVCCFGASRLFHNQGDGTFHEVAGVLDRALDGFASTAVWADVDRDGLPDLFLARYVEWSPETDLPCLSNLGERDVCGPTGFPGTIPTVLHNEGDGRFDDWSRELGIRGNSKGLGLLAADLDDDGWIDFYLANDETANQLYWGGAARPLTEDGWGSGVAANELGMEEGSMGIGAGDYDGDGRLDVWVTNFESEDNALYRNLGGRAFQYATVRAGLAGVSRMQVGFGTALADFDGDAWPDVLVLNGHAMYTTGQTPHAQRPQLFRNQGQGRFEEVSDRGGPYFRRPHAGRGNAVGDLDDDGAPDVVATHLNAPLSVLRNRHPPASFLRVWLRGTGGALEAVGARVTVRNQERSHSQCVVRGAGYFSHSDDRLLFPLASDTSRVDVTVQWPGRALETFHGLTTGTTHVLIEGRGTRDARP
ncbi:MAG: CRTAC1 family protein [Planctomycetales bacterium]